MVYRASGEVALLPGQDELSGEGLFPGFRCRIDDS